jgi:hypothetical protein
LVIDGDVDVSATFVELPIVDVFVFAHVDVKAKGGAQVHVAG